MIMNSKKADNIFTYPCATDNNKRQFNHINTETIYNIFLSCTCLILQHLQSGHCNDQQSSTLKPRALFLFHRLALIIIMQAQVTHELFYNAKR